jgi:hypothetical protein
MRLWAKKGRPIPVNDVWLAAVSVVKGTVLVSADAHYSYVDRLQLEDWTAFLAPGYRWFSAGAGGPARARAPAPLLPAVAVECWGGETLP